MTVYVRFRDLNDEIDMRIFECKGYQVGDNLLELFDHDGNKVASFITDDISWWADDREDRQQ